MTIECIVEGLITRDIKRGLRFSKHLKWVANSLKLGRDCNLQCNQAGLYVRFVSPSVCSGNCQQPIFVGDPKKNATN